MAQAHVGLHLVWDTWSLFPRDGRRVKWWFPTILCSMFLVVPFLVPSFRCVPFIVSFIHCVHSYRIVCLFSLRYHEMVVSYYSVFLSSVPVFRSSFHPFDVFHLLYHSFIVFGVWSIYFRSPRNVMGAPHIFLGISIPVSYPIP
jgi:hypothetical protein